VERNNEDGRPVSCKGRFATHVSDVQGRRGFNRYLINLGVSAIIKFYYHPSPNDAKVALFLEESGLPYEVVPVDTRKGEQFKPEFVAINPNANS
jgi:hypothetical protein